MSHGVEICPKHGLRRKMIYGRLRCMVCKREANERRRKHTPEQRREAARVARERSKVDPLDERVERIWRERYSEQERAYYSDNFRKIGSLTVWGSE